MMQKAHAHCEDCPSRGAGVFCHLEKMVLDELSTQKVTNTFKKGQTLFMEGSPAFGLFCISSGSVKITKSSSNGKDSIVRMAKPGDLIGHHSLFTQESFQATATALEDSNVCFIDKTYIMKLIKERPSVALEVVSHLGQELGASEQKIASFCQKNVRERIAETLLILKEAHGVDHPESGGTKISLRLTREELASMVGTATETLIRFLSEFKEDGFIQQDGRYMVILNEEALADLAELTY